MTNYLYLFWQAIKAIFKILFWLLLLAAFVVFLVWLLGKIHPVFDIGIENWLLKIWEYIKNLVTKA